jgi:tryptophan halogenase
MDIPDSLQERIEIYKQNARLYRHDNELFNHVSWFSVMNGQGIFPQRYHPVADMLSEAQLNSRMNEIHTVTQKCLQAMPTHQAFLDKIMQ